ncbi:MAG TPA: ATP-binding protein [Candidatus Udaeobacter sp.]|nr:ATP-binding protein [Candidatus Udaeobacter sp.]
MAASRLRRPWRRYLVAVAAVAVASVLFALHILIHPWGDAAVTAVDDIGEGAAALAAAAACGWAARRRALRFRKGWAWIAAAAFSWGVGEVVWSVYEVGLGQAVPFPSAADVGFLAAIPFTVLGIRAFATAQRAVSSSARLWLDGLIIALALLFVGWTSGLNLVVTDPAAPLFNKIVSLAYPVGDIIVGTALILSIRGAVRNEQGWMLLLLCGIAFNAMADSAFAYLNATGAYTSLGSILDTGWFAGFLMIGLAALWPAAAERKVVVAAPIDLWQIAMPWMAILAASVAAVLRVMQGSAFDSFLSLDTAAIAGLMMLNQILVHRESLGLLVKTRTSEATLANVVAYAPAAIVRLDPELHILEANQQFGNLLHTASESQIGKPITSLFAGDDAIQFSALLEPLRSGETLAVVSDADAQRGDGTSMSVHWSATAVPAKRGGVDYFIATFDDITARRQQEAASAASLETLQRLNRVKTEFLQTLSHEFKTALVGILGFSQFMEDSDSLDPADIHGFAADIHKDADRLERLLNEMLDLDRLETSRATLALAPVDVNGLLETAAAGARHGVDGIVIVTNLDPTVPPIAADASKLGEAFRGLMQNAIRYSPDGGRIEVTSRMKEPDLEVIVSDQGTGVRADFDRRLFGSEDIYAESPVRRLMGTGLGLGIIRQIADLHGGRVWIERVEGKGSEFHFLIPALDMHASRITVEAASAKPLTAVAPA